MPTNNPQMSNGGALSWQLQLPFHSKQEIKNVFHLKLVILPPPTNPSKADQSWSLFQMQKREVSALLVIDPHPPAQMHKTCLGLFSIKVTEYLPLWNWAFSHFLTFCSLYKNFPLPPSFPSVFRQQACNHIPRRKIVFQNWRSSVPLTSPRLLRTLFAKHINLAPNLKLDA